MSKRLLLAALTLVLLSSACGGGGEATSTLVPTREAAAAPTSTTKAEAPPAEPTATTKAEAPAAEPTSTSNPEAPPVEATPADVPEAAPTEVPEPTKETKSEGLLDSILNLGSINVDPEQLAEDEFQSYRLRVRWSVEPKTGSNEVASDMTMEVAHTSDPLAEEFTMASGDQPGFSAIRIGEVMWIQTGEQWIEMSSDDMSMEDTLFDLNQATDGLSGDAEFVGNEEVNDIATRHYSFDETVPGMALGIYGKIKGDVWVAEEGDYTVRYVYAAENDDATYSWEWELYDINAPIVIEPPAEAQGAREDIPMMPDATDRASVGPMTTYESATNAEDVVEFYEEHMPAQGWTYNMAESSVSDMFNMLSFSKEGLTVTIMVSPNDDGGTAVIIQAGE